MPGFKKCLKNYQRNGIIVYLQRNKNQIGIRLTIRKINCLEIMKRCFKSYKKKLFQILNSILSKLSVRNNKMNAFLDTPKKKKKHKIF